MEDYHSMMKYSNLRKQISMLGINPDKFAEYFTPKMRENPNPKKPKHEWDNLYFNYGRNLKSPPQMTVILNQNTVEE